jgi:phosphatidate cytidylyltransferase
LVLAEKRQGETRRRLLVVAVLLPLVLAILAGPPQAFAVLVAAAALICVAELLFVYLAAPIQLPKLEAAAAIYLTLAFKAIVSLRYDYGRGAIILVLAIAFVGDTAAYAGGRRFGKTPLLPSVSPGKTVEGAIFGLTGSMLGAVIVAAPVLGILAHFNLAEVLALGLVGGIAGQIGDLAESKYKRLRGVKDSSRLLGAHGGMLDRIDALMAVSLVVWLGLKIMLG